MPSRSTGGLTSSPRTRARYRTNHQTACVLFESVKISLGETRETQCAVDGLPR